MTDLLTVYNVLNMLTCAEMLNPPFMGTIQQCMYPTICRVCPSAVSLLPWRSAAVMNGQLWEYFWVSTVSFLRRIDPEVKFWVMSKTHTYQFPHISTSTSKKILVMKKMLVHLDLQLSDDQWCWTSFLSSLANCFLFGKMSVQGLYPSLD